MSKNIAISLFIILCNFIYAQEDTLFFKRSNFKSCTKAGLHGLLYFSQNLDTININESKSYSDDEIDTLLPKHVQMCNYLDSIKPLIIFIDKKGRLIETGYYNYIGFNNFYKGYYKSGIKRVEGSYIYNNKTGIWKYYNRQGKLIKTKEYYK